MSTVRLLKDKYEQGFYSFFEHGKFDKPLFLLTEDEARFLHKELTEIIIQEENKQCLTELTK